MHYKLCHLIRVLNKTFTFQLLCALTSSITDILFQSYFLYHVLFVRAADITAVTIICPIVWLVDEAIELYLLVNATASTCESANSTADYLHELRNELSNMDVESHIQMYSLQLLHQRIQVSAMGFFNIDYSLMYSVIAAVSTYLVILIQLDQSSAHR
nr:gustatory receptor [Semanotus bifasciatus]